MLAYLGIAGGILMWLIPVGSVFDIPELASIVTGATGEPGRRSVSGHGFFVVRVGRSTRRQSSRYQRSNP